MPIAESNITCVTIPVAANPQSIADKAKELHKASGPAAYSIDGESTSFRSLKELAEFQDWCDRRAVASDPCSAVIDCEIDYSRASPNIFDDGIFE